MGKKAAKKDTQEKAAPEVHHKPLVLAPEREHWVELDFRLLNWKWMNFKKKYNLNTHIFTIKKELADRHGRMSELKLCVGDFSEGKEITNDMLTLKEIEYIQGVQIDPDLPMDEQGPIPLVQIFYDFKPCDSGDPVLLYFAS